jgi:hydrogenase 3 maturation protease
VPRLQAVLKHRLDGDKRLAILGMGSEFRADDIAGILVAQRVKELTRGRRKSPRLRIFIGGTAPENLTGQLKRFKPTHLVIVDAADSGAKPGTVVVLEPEDTCGTSFCTHSLPTKVLTDYLLEYFPCRFTLIGIQPKDLTMGASPTPAVLKACETVATTIAGLLA